MEGVALNIPKEWNLNLDITPIMGGVEDNISLYPSAVVDPSKNLTLKGTVFMGGIKIKRF
jgi:hypothetical protein